jgi:ABC-type dipeptide/oligopeptide/nickel transport system ATPase component
MALLEINNLSISFNQNAANVFILKNINFELDSGDSIALIGESGSGKTTIARSILGLLDEGLAIENGEILFKGQNLFKLNEKEKTSLRGKKISMLPQESLNVLDPLVKCGLQIGEVLLSNGEKEKTKVFELVLAMLSQCGFPEPETIYNKYPHELSGGNRQKILFAIANISKPELLITDEPTSSLDLGSEKEILDLLNKFKAEYKQSILFITHDIGIAKEISNKILVLKSGILIESGTTAEIFENPKEEYTKLLIENAKTHN